LKTQLFALAFRLVPRVPRAVLLGLAPLVGTIAWLVARGMRERATASLRHIPTLAANPAQLRRAVRGLFTQLMLNYVDLFVPPLGPPEALAPYFIIDDLGLITDTVARNKGCIFVSVHFSGFEWARWRMKQIVKVPIIAPVEALEPPALFDLVARERGKSGITFLPVTEGQTLREMIAALRRGEAVLIAVDRDVVRNGVVMPFFGAPAQIPTGVVALARLTGAPVLGVTSWRDGLGHYYGNARAIDLPVDRSTRGEEAMRAALEPLVRWMEETIASHPEQWLAALAGDVWLPESVAPAEKGPEVTVAMPPER
jgi:lauroyl/myristoyl acyltransferase